MTTASHAETRFIEAHPGEYHCLTHRDGVDDVIVITARNDGRGLASIHYWNEYDELSAQTRATGLLLSAAPELRDLVRRMLAIGERIPTKLLDADYYAWEQEAHALLDSLRVPFKESPLSAEIQRKLAGLFSSDDSEDDLFSQ